MSAIEQLSERVSHRLEEMAQAVACPPLIEQGELTRLVGLKLEASGCHAAIGSRCQIIADSQRCIEAEVVGFTENGLLLMPEGSLSGIRPGARVLPLKNTGLVAVDESLIGRVIDGAGRPMDGGPPLKCAEHVALHGKPINPLHRRPIAEPLDTGVRAINALLTLGKGQRIGLFAGSGVGKSTLLGMLTRNTQADIVVVALIGERGREVREFIDHILGDQGLQKAIVVATPADDPPLMRVHGAWRATAIAEYFRHQGKQVLLLMDSLTRFAQAQREIGLAVGEPPVTKGYPPSVFSLLPSLVERAGNGNGEGGAITAIYTVLVEGDDHDEPIADAARAILDGHVVLSRSLAEAGLYPAIDVEASISRAMTNIVKPEHQDLARKVKQVYSVYQENKDLIAIGAYKKGSDPAIDQAIGAIHSIRNLIRQEEREAQTFQQSYGALQQLTVQLAPPARVQVNGNQTG